MNPLQQMTREYSDDSLHAWPGSKESWSVENPSRGIELVEWMQMDVLGVHTHAWRIALVWT